MFGVSWMLRMIRMFRMFRMIRLAWQVHDSSFSTGALRDARYPLLRLRTIAAAPDMVSTFRRKGCDRFFEDVCLK